MLLQRAQMMNCPAFQLLDLPKMIQVYKGSCNIIATKIRRIKVLFVVFLLNITCEWQIIKLILWLETITFCSQCWFLVLTSSKQGWQLQNIATKYSNKTSNHKFNLSYFTIGKRELNYNHRFWQLSGLLKNCM